MAKKDKQGRLLIPSDIWKMSGFCNFDGSLDLGFFVTTDLKVCITHISHAKKADLEFLCYCNLDFKRRFVLQENVDAFLGSGDIYYFSTCLNSDFPLVYIQKTDNLKYQCSKILLEGIKKSFDRLYTYLEENIND